MQKETASVLRYLAEMACMLYAGGYMLLYGTGKLLGWQFNNQENAPPLTADASGMALMWRFFGYAPGYTFIIGVMQVLGSLMLFWRKTRLAGCFLLLGIMLNVVLMDIFYGVAQGALAIAIMVCLCLLAIVWMHRGALVASLNALAGIPAVHAPEWPVMKRIGLLVTVIIGLLVLEFCIRLFGATVFS